MSPSNSVPVKDDSMDLDELQTKSTPKQSAANATAEDDDGLADAENTDREEEDGYKKWVINDVPAPRKISERRRADNVAFDAWIEENQQQLLGNVENLIVDDDRTIQSLIKGSENKRIITSPRDYQLELFELAKTQNTIAVLDTGSGKTLIAALLLRWTIQNELEDRSKGLSKRISFFLVDKVVLVFQQHEVLTCNLDYPVEKLCGDMVQNVPDEFWSKAFEENMAIVCTADILHHCLTHSYIRMDQVNLLVFDEAHHTKKNHPYARIIKDFYADIKDEKKRPRILGMTASPVDAQTDPNIAAAELEGLLHSQIATVADPVVLQNSSAKPKHEVLVEYGKRLPDWETDLNKVLKRFVGDHRVFKKPFDFTKTAAAELGQWCADRYWQLFFKEGELLKLESRTEREVLRQSAYSQGIGQHVDKVREAHNLVNQHQFARPTTSLLSSKVVLLLRILKDQFHSVDHNRRCIVFVKQRNVASLLADLLQQPEMKIPGLIPGVLVGGGRPDASYGNAKVTCRDQVVTISKFKKGELNCIFATSVAEEGLDIPNCNVIIRYDLNDTLIQYIQSRGRARQEGSIYIHMVESENPEHCRKIAQNQRSEDALRRFCEAMPEDRKLTGNNFNMDYFLRKEKGQRQYTVPETGAKLNYKQSLACLAAFVASLPHPPEVNITANYVVLPVPGGFQCEVTLPDPSPIKNATGKVHASKAVAKCSAAYEMCLMLIKDKYLDEHLRPTFTKQLPAMRNARLAVSSKKKKQYNMRVKPEIWSAVGQPTELYVLALTLTDPILGRKSCPLLLLTRQPLQEIASFPLYFEKNRSSTVRCVLVPGRIMLDELRVHGLTTFTLTVFKDVFSKEYEATTAQLPYFLAPTKMGHSSDFTSVDDASHVVDWATIMFVKENERINCTLNEPDEFFVDKFVCDPYDGARKFILRGRRHDMKPTDPVPEGIVAPGHRAWRVTCERHDILNYSLSAWSKSRALMTLQEDQPVIEADLLPIRRDFLNDNIGDDDMKPKSCFLVLEPLRVSPLPVNVVVMVYAFPAIMHRIDSNLVALEACAMLNLDIRPDLALEAFTKSSGNANEHDVADKMNYQGGTGNSYERLEFLGDCFLKMATTISIFTRNPDKAEFEYHVKRMLLICNRNLFNNALEVKLEEYIRSIAFDRRSWYPEGLTLRRGKRKDVARGKHVLADKTIADVCEALIGAAYLTAQGRSHSDFDLAVRAVSIMVRDPNHAATTYGDYYAAYVPPAWQMAPCNSVQLDMAARFRARIGYAFRHPRLLRSAFQHPSYPTMYERLPSYQRLEFLGDGLLDMACVEFLFFRFPSADPQWLTEHKMAMVSNQFLGSLAVCLGFHRDINHCSPEIQRDVAEYVAEVKEEFRAAKGKDKYEEEDEEQEVAFTPGDFWTRCLRRPPKCLADVVEAYVGAIFVDSQYDFGEVRRFFRDRIRPFFEDMRPYDDFAGKHPATSFAASLRNRMRCSEWRLLAKELPAHTLAATASEEDGGGGRMIDFGAMATSQVVCAVRVHGQTLAYAVSASSRDGKIEAAEKALKTLEGMEVDEFKKTYGCTCALDTIEEDGSQELGHHGSAV